MEQVTQSAFALKRFHIPSFIYSEADDKFVSIDVQFNPSGIYNPQNGEFKLSINIAITAATKEDIKDYHTVIKLEANGYFSLTDNPTFEAIPDYFYGNSIAIIFPYVRAFISSLTVQAGNRLLVLPILNLTSLTDVLKTKTISLNFE